ncbi:GNAT family N-acetyltransferase [Cytobacillus sp. Hz8]|uniref:GNAT family N-acetyltransferase n=1 Tax=Cytobacillus sp. Hz8 TaxID=3347168 RepID=UPI0035DAFD06
MEWIKSSLEYVSIELEILNSQPAFNLLSDNKTQLTADDLRKEFQSHPFEKERYLIQLNGEYAGIVDFVMENPKDHMPWLGLFIFHQKYEGKGLASQAYKIYEGMMIERGVSIIRLGCFQDNKKGLHFWEKHHFKKIKLVEFNEKPLWILEKHV